MTTKIEQLTAEIGNLRASNAEEAEQLRIKYLGRKGVMNDLMEEFRTVAPEQKRELGQKINALKQLITAKINELQESVKAKDSAIVNLNGQLERAREDLANANAKVSELSGKLDEGVKALEAKDRELAEVRDSLAKANEHAKHLEETRSLLTGGVLTLPEEVVDVGSGKTPEAREALRRQKAAKVTKK
jgi:chromosome segregation ATPase